MKTQFDKDCVKQPTTEQLSIVDNLQYEYILDANGKLQDDFDSIRFHKDGTTVFVVYKSGRIVVIGNKNKPATVSNIMGEEINRAIKEIERRGGTPVGKEDPRRTTEQTEMINQYMSNDDEKWNVMLADANGIDVWGLNTKEQTIDKITISNLGEPIDVDGKKIIIYDDRMIKGN